MAVDARGRPLAIRITAGQAGDNPELLPTLSAIRVPTGHRPRSRPDVVIADKAYSHPSTRQALRGKGISAVIPERDDQISRRAGRGSSGGRPPDFDPQTYKQRNVVERGFNRLKQWRGIATAPPLLRAEQLERQRGRGQSTRQRPDGEDDQADQEQQAPTQPVTQGGRRQ